LQELAKANDMTFQGFGKRPRVVLDTDTYNEIDDQFALAYLLRARDRAETEAIYAAPFLNKRSSSASDGMEKSYEEIGRLLNRLEMRDFPVFPGSEHFLTERPQPTASPAVAHLIELAMTATEAQRLNIVAIGALTNVASAILIEPGIVSRCNVIWLGGHQPGWSHNREFNLQGDLAATRAVFDSGVPLFVVPCLAVASHLLTSRHELAAFLDANDPVSGFLLDRFVEYGPSEGVWTKEIWDIAAVAWVVLPDAVESVNRSTPEIADNGDYIDDSRRNPCRFAVRLNRDAVFADMFERLQPGSNLRSRTN
jgi:inosine-uridine nucleoside N-ribohydrolase